MPTPADHLRSAAHLARLDAVLWRAAHDLAFRRRLLDVPHVALAEHGVRVPTEIRVRCIERHPDVDALIVLPDFAGLAASAPPADPHARAALDAAALDDVALDDAALAYVCGGVVFGAPWLLVPRPDPLTRPRP